MKQTTKDLEAQIIHLKTSLNKSKVNEEIINARYRLLEDGIDWWWSQPWYKRVWQALKGEYK